MWTKTWKRGERRGKKRRGEEERQRKRERERGGGERNNNFSEIIAFYQDFVHYFVSSFYIILEFLLQYSKFFVRNQIYAQIRHYLWSHFLYNITLTLEA